MDKILFAADDTLSSQDAVDMVRHLLTAWPKAELLVLYVTSLNEYTGDTLPNDVAYTERRTAADIEEQARVEWFQDCRDRVRFRHAYGPAAIAITTIAEEEKVDLIVVGSHGSGDVDRLLVGSVSHGVVYCARTPVLVVRNWQSNQVAK